MTEFGQGSYHSALVGMRSNRWPYNILAAEFRTHIFKIEMQVVANGAFCSQAWRYSAGERMVH